MLLLAVIHNQLGLGQVLLQEIALAERRIGVVFAVVEVADESESQLLFYLGSVGVGEEDGHGEGSEEGVLCFVSDVGNSNKLVIF